MKKTTINPPRTTWKGKLLRLLHITTSSSSSSSRTTTTTVQPLVLPLKRHDDIIPPVVVPRTQPLVVDDDADPPSCLPTLPYDIILDILTRLPPECILKCQRVSRPLRLITTTPFFTRMQRQPFTTVIVVQLPSDEYTKLHFMDKEFKRIDEKFTGLTTCDNPNFLVGSHDGFLMFTRVKGKHITYNLWNPLTGERLTMNDENEYACGLYFNPVTNDHEMLYYAIEYGDTGYSRTENFNFHAYSLRSKQRRRIGWFFYPPSIYKPPVIINETLYWMIERSEKFFLFNRGLNCPSFSDSIMSFNIRTEEFSSLEPGGRKYSTTEPGEVYSNGMIRIGHLHLSEMDGELCLCDFETPNQLLLSIFNHATQRWSTTTIVNLPVPNPPRCDNWPWQISFAAEVVQIKDNELLIRHGKGLLLYNMHSHACKISDEMIGDVTKRMRVTVHTHIIDYIL